METSEVNKNEASFQLNNFTFNLTLKDTTELLISAKKDNSPEHFKFKVSSENVRELTSYIFPDLEVLFVSLLDAFENKDPAVSIDFNEKDGKFTYSWERTFRDRKRIETFTWELQEIKPNDQMIEDLLTKVDKQEKRILFLEEENRRLKFYVEKVIMERLDNIEKVLIPDVKEGNHNDIMKLSQKFEAFEGEVIPKMNESQIKEDNIKSDSELAIAEKLTQIERIVIPEVKENNDKRIQKVEEIFTKIVENLEKQIPKQVKEEVEKNMLESQKLRRSSLLIAEDNKIPAKNLPIEEFIIQDSFEFDKTYPSAKSISFLNENKTVVCTAKRSLIITCVANKPLQRGEKNQFSIKVENTKNSHITIGICPDYLRTKTRLYNQNKVYCYFGCDDGVLYTNSTVTNLKSPGIKKNAIVTVIVDFEENQIEFQVNQVLRAKTKIAAFDSNSYDYYPFVELMDLDDQVSFV